jgi:hypothetical protein
VDLKEEEAGVNPARHWYYRSKARAVATLLDGRITSTSEILDVGAGSGFFSTYLLKHSDAAGATCVDINYVADTGTVVDGKPVRFRRASTTPADIVLMMDVLEHVEDDHGLLSQYVATAPAGASFLISVPAFQFLWSPHDEYLGHFRRYRLSEVEQLVRRAGLDAVTGTYFFAAILPAVAIFRAVRRGRAADSSDLVHSATSFGPVLERILAAELRLLGRNRLAGVTVFVLARKTPHADTFVRA